MEEIATRSMKDAAAVKLLTIIMMVYLPATIVLVRENLTQLFPFPSPFTPSLSALFERTKPNPNNVGLEFLLHRIHHQDSTAGRNGNHLGRPRLDHYAGDLGAIDSRHYRGMVALEPTAVRWSEVGR